jgi:acid phosphatase family membrane protein YuiD
MKDLKFWEMALNPPLVSALVAMGSSQLSKAIRPLFGGKPLDIRRLVDYGGFPSSHSAFIAACACAIGFTEGFRSSAFALAVVAASIFIYDILRLRMTVAQSKKELDRLIAREGLERLEPPPQFGAHSLPEVLAGIAWGLACAMIVCLLWP